MQLTPGFYFLYNMGAYQDFSGLQIEMKVENSCAPVYMYLISLLEVY